MYTEPDKHAPAWEPFQRWRQAEAVLADAERRQAPAAELVALSNAVIIARVTLIKARISNGWQPAQEAIDQLTKDEALLAEGEGAVAYWAPSNGEHEPPPVDSVIREPRSVGKLA